MCEVKIISCHTIFNESALVISNKYNIPIEKEFNPQPYNLYLVLGAHEKSVELYYIQQQMNNKIGYIIYNTEQLDSIHLKNKYYLQLLKNNPLFNFSHHISREFIDKFKIIPHSFFTFDYMVWPDEEERDIDILFVGTKTEKREKIYKKLLTTYPDKNIKFDFTNSNMTPDKITKLLKKSKIVLNIPAYENNGLETHRINKAISCGCKVVSLPSADKELNEEYSNYVLFTEDIVEDVFDEYTGSNWEALNINIIAPSHKHNVQIIEIVKNKLDDMKKKDENIV
jgi:hypothetical protein